MKRQIARALLQRLRLSPHGRLPIGRRANETLLHRSLASTETKRLCFAATSSDGIELKTIHLPHGEIDDEVDCARRRPSVVRSLDAYSSGPVAPISVNFNHQLAYLADHSDTTHVRHQPTAVA